MFWNSELGTFMENGHFTSEVEALQLGAIIIPSLLIKDTVYLLCPWLMKPYIGHLNPQQAHLNWCLSQTHTLIKCASSYPKGHY